MELSDFKVRVLEDEITRLDLYLHKGLDWVEHSFVSTDVLFEEIVGSWESFEREEKVEILSEFLKLYSVV